MDLSQKTTTIEDAVLDIIYKLTESIGTGFTCKLKTTI